MLFDRILPAEAVSGALRITLIDRRQVLIEQHRGIIGYTENKVTVRLKDGYLVLCGEGLKIGEYSGQDVAVSGKVCSLEFKP